MASNTLISTTTLLLIFGALLFIATAIVVDTDGDTVLNGGRQYYIIPQDISVGGGLSLKPKSEDSPCPLYIARDKDETSRGIPVTISSPLRISIIATSLPVHIAFKGNIDVCMQPMGWQVIPDESTYITTGGRGYPFNPVETFSIVESEENKDGYYIRLIAREKYVGFIQKEGFLGITNKNPLLVKFKKVYDDDVLLMKV